MYVYPYTNLPLLLVIGSTLCEYVVVLFKGIVSTTFVAKLFDSTYTISIFLIFNGFVYAVGALKKYNLSPATIDGEILFVVVNV